jgi:hypothetical protein
MTEGNSHEGHTARCPFCGGGQFTEGAIRGWGELHFFKTHKAGLNPAGELIAAARKCDGCGNVQIFVK